MGGAALDGEGESEGEQSKTNSLKHLASNINRLMHRSSPLCTLVTTPQLFSENLPAFHTILSKTGSVYFPFKAHCLNRICHNLSALAPLYDITFLKRWELDEVKLWKFTQNVDPDIMENVFRKNIDQEDKYCLIDEAELDLNVSGVREVYSWIEGKGDVRFIKLTPVEGRKEEAGGKKGKKKMKKKKKLEGGFVHMRDKVGVKPKEKKPSENTTIIKNIMSGPPPTYEQLVDPDAGTATKWNRWEAWCLGRENLKRYNFFASRAIRDGQGDARMVQAPR